MAQNPRVKALLDGKILTEFAKRIGDKAIGVAADREEALQARRIPFELAPLDKLTLGGQIHGDITLVYGTPESCKSLIGYRQIAAYQRTCMACFKRIGNGCECKKSQPGVAALVDVESRYTPAWGAAQGIDNENLIFRRPENAEMAVDLVDALMYAGVDFVMVDSIAFMATGNEIDKDASQNHVTPLPRLLALATKKMSAAGAAQFNASKALPRRTGLYVITQIRSKAGVVYGSPETISGGNAIQFASSTIFRFNKTKPHVDDKLKVPIYTDYEVRKIKGQGMTGGEGSFRLYHVPFDGYDRGRFTDFPFLSEQSELVELLKYERGTWSILGETFEVEGEGEKRKKAGLALVEARYRDDPAFAKRWRDAFMLLWT